MRTPKFTPGPWVKDYAGTIGHIKSVAERLDGKTPTVSKYPHASNDLLETLCLSDEEVEANARLIAAAPEMYDLLATIENGGQQVPTWLWNRIQSCLNKVDGDQW